jgi:transcriptional regulator with XRE-family HTH domain
MPRRDDEPMTSDVAPNSARAVAELLRSTREDAELTQAQLGRRAGVARSTVAAYESGRHVPSLGAIDRLLTALGRQLRLDIEPIAADVDAAIDRALEASLDERIEQHAHWLPGLLTQLKGVPFVVDGAAAAFVQGAPLPIECLEIVMATTDLAVLNYALERTHARRWNERWRDWGYDAIDPRRDGPPRWWTWFGEVKLRVAEVRPRAIEVTVGEHRIAVRPLVEIEADDAAIQRILARLRQRLGSAA